MSELQKQLDETVRKSIQEASMGTVDLTLLGATLAEGAIYLNHSSLTGNVWECLGLCRSRIDVCCVNNWNFRSN